MKLKKTIEYEVDEINKKLIVWRPVIVEGWVHCRWCDTDLEIVDKEMEEVVLVAETKEELLEKAKAEGYEIIEEGK